MLVTEFLPGDPEMTPLATVSNITVVYPKCVDGESYTEPRAAPKYCDARSEVLAGMTKRDGAPAPKGWPRQGIITAVRDQCDDGQSNGRHPFYAKELSAIR